MSVRIRCTWLAAALAAFLFGVNCYRAVRQSITFDEAVTYNKYVSQPIAKTFTEWDANNHVLYTLLARASTSMFSRTAEWTLRVPSLLGGLLYLISAYRICRLLFGDGWYFLLAFACLTLNPFILDYMSVARGYGLATALLLASLDQLARHLISPIRAWRLYAAGIALALSVAANLTLLFPGAALTFTFAGVHLWPAFRARDRAKLAWRASAIIDHMVLPGIVCAVALLLFPLSHASRESFYFGSKSLGEASYTLLAASLWRDHHPLSPRVDSAFANAGPILARYGAAAIVIIGAVVLWRGRRRLSPAAVLPWGTLAGSVVLLVIAHYTIGLVYPQRRTGLYLVPLFTLVCLALPRRIAAPAGVVVIAMYLALWNTAFYDEWVWDSSTREVARYLRRVRATRVGCNWLYWQSLEFYRRTMDMDWMQPVTGNGPDGDYDVYVLNETDRPLVEKRHLTIDFERPYSSLIVAHK